MGLSQAEDGSICPMVAVRSTGLAMDSIIGIRSEVSNISLVDETYLKTLLQIANERFETNTRRIKRFQATLLSSYGCDFLPQRPGQPSKKAGWEDPQSRRERKRQEGLARQQVMHRHRAESADKQPNSIVPAETTLEQRKLP